jgi:hypothetical protein
MAENLLRDSWADLDQADLRLLLQEQIGRPGQYDGDDEDLIHLPLAREECRVSFTFKGAEIVAIEPGLAFDRQEWDRICAEIEGPIQKGPQKIGRELSFSTHRVDGWWLANGRECKSFRHQKVRRSRTKVRTIPSFSNSRSKMRVCGPPPIIPSPINAAVASIGNSRSCSTFCSWERPNSYPIDAEVFGPMFTPEASRNSSGCRNGTSQTSGRSWSKNFRRRSAKNLRCLHQTITTRGHRP